jgi:hypothetical protein
VTYKLIIVSNFPGNQQAFIVFATNVVTCFTGNVHYPNPPVALATLTSLIAALVAAEGLVATKVKDAAKARDSARAKVEAALTQLEAYATTVVEQAAPADAPAILASSGFSAKKPSKHTKDAYSVDRGDTAGSAVIDLKTLGKHGKVQYCHQYSINGGTTWVDLPPTLDAATTVTGLPLGQNVLFRFRTLIKGVYGDWSQTFTFFVH